LTGEIRSTEDIGESTTVLTSKNEEKADDFSRLLLDAIDEALKRLFNETAVGSVYFYIERMCHLPREEIAEKPEVFSTSLEKLMGQGALVLADKILKALYVKLGLELAEEEGYGFADCICELRDRFKVQGLFAEPESIGE